MPTRKYAPKRKLRRTKGRRTKRRYGRKRGGLGGWFSSLTGSTKSDSETACINTCKAKEIERKNAEEADAGQVPADAGQVPVEVGQGGGRRRRRRRSSKKRSSKKSRKSRKTKRRHSGGCIGHAFQPSIVNPPNSALANPAPFARYTTGP